MRNTCQISSRILHKPLPSHPPDCLMVPKACCSLCSSQPTHLLPCHLPQPQPLSPSLAGAKLVSCHTAEASVILGILSSLQRALRGHWAEQIPPPCTLKVFVSMEVAKTSSPCPRCHAKTWPVGAQGKFCVIRAPHAAPKKLAFFSHVFSHFQPDFSSE